MELNKLQQRTYEVILKTYGERTKGYESEIKQIIITTSNLMSEMFKNKDIGESITKTYYDSCLKNVRILYDILEIIKPNENVLEDEKTIYFILIMYCQQCEAISFLFKDFVHKYINKSYTTMGDFVLVFKRKYPQYLDELFNKRFIPQLRNAVSHNQVVLDNTQKIIQYPEKSEIITLTFHQVVNLYDTLMMIYLAIVIELTQPRA